MNFYPNQLFHVYNQGNNRQTIFFKNEHYDYFLWKMKAFLIPFADIISYCLMPTHFHWQIYVRNVTVERKVFRKHVDSIENDRRLSIYSKDAVMVKSSSNLKTKEDDFITLNESIGVLQMAYTKAINKEKNWTGSLFRKDCKAKDGWIDEFITVTKSSGKLDYRFTASSDFALTCFEYIHKNPSEAGLVNNLLDWNYSSAKEYAGLNEMNICNVKLGKEIMGGNLNLTEMSPPEALRERHPLS